jgi:TPP-dependent pyruvate/acetoin dehydrogenase alpha subunit
MTGDTTAHSARVAGKKGFSLISDEKFRELYAALLLCIVLDERLPASSGYKRWTGREAASAGVVACLHAGDSVTATARGVLAGYLHNGSLFPARGAGAASRTGLAAATGDALRHKVENMGNVAVLFADEGEPGRMRETLARAAAQSLPVFYILNSGGRLAEVCGNVPVIRVDGSDAVAVYRVAHESITRARHGGGPTIMECAAWPDDRAPDPLLKLERYLAGRKLFTNHWKRRLERKYAESLDQALGTTGPPKQ